jgi:hypothetical protein
MPGAGPGPSPRRTHDRDPRRGRRTDPQGAGRGTAGPRRRLRQPRTIAIGLRSGLLEALGRDPAGATAEELAEELDLDPFYVSVWCRAALAAGVCERDGDRFALAPHVATLLLDRSSPAYVGGVFPVLEQPEMFGRFEANLASGERLWWDECSPDWIAGVAGTGTPFYIRLVPAGLGQVPGLTERLAAGGLIVDSAPAEPGSAWSGWPSTSRPAGSSAWTAMPTHGCRDIDRVAERILATLEPGGWFVISDFPFPDTDEGLRSVPGRVMGAIPFVEAQIDDQLLPRAHYDTLLARHGFTDPGSASLTPMHARTWGRRRRR